MHEERLYPLLVQLLAPGRGWKNPPAPVGALPYWPNTSVCR